jgi:hypothetical protein
LRNAGQGNPKSFSSIAAGGEGFALLAARGERLARNASVTSEQTAGLLRVNSR